MVGDELVDFDADEDFKEDLQRIKREDQSRYSTVESRCQAIRKDPFKGEWKRWKMEGLYGEHVDDHWVILYELEPNLAPNANKSSVGEVYFHRVVHHDDQEEAVKNINRIGTSLRFEAVMPYGEGQSTVPKLYKSDFVVVEDEQYRDDGVVMAGTLPDEDGIEARFEDLLPDGSDTSYTTPSISDLTD